MLGGGGAERAPSSWAEHSTKCRPDDYPLDQFWKGEAPKQDYNYMHVGSEGQPTRYPQSFPAVVGRGFGNRATIRFFPVEAATLESLQSYRSVTIGSTFVARRAGK